MHKASIGTVWEFNVCNVEYEYRKKQEEGEARLGREVKGNKRTRDVARELSRERVEWARDREREKREGVRGGVKKHQWAEGFRE